MFGKLQVVFFIYVLFIGWCSAFGRNVSDRNCERGVRWRSETIYNFVEKVETISNSYEYDVFELWNKFSIFTMENITKISEDCFSEVEKFMLGVRENNMDAVKMFDATGKLSSGILRGNVNQFGDFDECLSVKEAQYCLAEIDLESNWTNPHSEFRNLVHSYFAIRETFDDVKHRVPGFSMVRWGFCIPKKCSAKDLEIVLKEKYGIMSSIKPQMCQTSQKIISQDGISWGELTTRCLFLLLALLTVIGTIRGIYEQNINEKNKLLQLVDCFNFSENLNDLTRMKETKDEVKTLHGVRAFGAFALILSHKTMALFYNPYINRTTMSENLGMKWSVIGRTAIIYTDAFMLISGFLNAHLLFKELDRGKTMKFGDKIITRIFRISPNIIAVILFCTYILPYLGEGPLWPTVVDHHSNLCKNNMWRNMLYIHNYFPFQDMCLTHTHQVGIDMQLFLTTPLVIYVIWSSRKIGMILLGGIILASTVLRFVVTWNNNLSHVVHFGISISRMFDTANLSYILPTHRATIYFMGVFLAYIMRDKAEIYFSKKQLGIYWTFFMLLGFGTWLGPMHMSHPGYVYNKIDAALYGALSPITFGSAVAWTIYATEKGYGGFFGAIFAWDKFKYFTKIAYAVYLVQFPLFFYNVGKTKHADEFSPSEMFQVTETLAIIIISIALTALVEIPFQKLKVILFQGKKNRPKPTNETTDLNQNDASLSEKMKKL